MEPTEPEKSEGKEEIGAKIKIEPKKHHHHHKTRVKKVDFWKGASIILGILLILSLVSKGFTTTGIATSSLSPEQASEKAIGYINKNLLQPGTEAELVEITDLDTLYSLKISITGREFESYISKDGRYLFPTGVDTEQPIEVPDAPTPPPPAEVPKTETPKVQLFVMSQCPFGTIAESAIKPVLELLGDNVDYELRYIANEQGDGSFNSLHGQPEVDGNIRQLCVEKYYPAKHLDYITCVNENYRDLEGNWERCAEENNIDSTKIETCWNGDEGPSLFSENIKLGNELGVGSSPTLIINDVPYSGQRTSEAYKQSICSAFTTPPEGCGEVLSTDGAKAEGSC